MRLSDLEEVGGGFEDKNGCYHETKADFIQTKVLGFCGCGLGDDMLEWMRDLLSELNPSGSQEDDYKARWERKEKMLGWDKEENVPGWIVMYWLDKEEYTEHGGSVCAGWLTEKGIGLLEDLNEALRP